MLMKRRHLLMVCHTQSGRAERLALAAWHQARLEEGVETRLRRAVDADCSDLLWAQALLLVAPENFGTAAGGMKEFLDRVYYPLERAGVAGLPYAMILTAGNDGTGTMRQLERILAGLSMKRVQDTLVVHGIPDGRHEQLAGELGQSLAAGLALGVF